MDRIERIGDVAAIMRDYVENKQTFLTEKTMSVPSESYTDPDQWKAEMELVFKRVPLMLAFTAEYDGGEICPQEGEIEDAGWYHIDALPTIPAQLSVAYRLIRHTADWLRLPADQRK